MAWFAPVGLAQVQIEVFEQRVSKTVVFILEIFLCFLERELRVAITRRLLGSNRKAHNDCK